MSKSIITNYTDISAFSGAPAECIHHCVFGRGLRQLADEDGLFIGLTNAEHNMSAKGSVNQLHENIVAEKLSKMLGEIAWEREYLATKLARVNIDGLDEQSVEEWKEEARLAFRQRYNQNYV